jgi:hypothetical protein
VPQFAGPGAWLNGTSEIPTRNGVERRAVRVGQPGCLTERPWDASATAFGSEDQSDSASASTGTWSMAAEVALFWASLRSFWAGQRPISRSELSPWPLESQVWRGESSVSSGCALNQTQTDPSRAEPTCHLSRCRVAERALRSVTEALGFRADANSLVAE